MKQISDVIADQVLTVIEPGINVRNAAQTMADRNIGAVAVVASGKLAGIFSERDIMARVVAKGLNPEDTLVEGVMSKQLVVADPSENIDQALNQIHSIRARHPPVVSERLLVRIVSIRDLLEVNDAP